MRDIARRYRRQPFYADRRVFWVSRPSFGGTSSMPSGCAGYADEAGRWRRRLTAEARSLMVLPSLSMPRSAEARLCCCGRRSTIRGCRMRTGVLIYGKIRRGQRPGRLQLTTGGSAQRSAPELSQNSGQGWAPPSIMGLTMAAMVLIRGARPAPILRR